MPPSPISAMLNLCGSLRSVLICSIANGGRGHKSDVHEPFPEPFPSPFCKRSLRAPRESCYHTAPAHLTWGPCLLPPHWGPPWVNLLLFHPTGMSFLWQSMVSFPLYSEFLTGGSHYFCLRLALFIHFFESSWFSGISLCMSLLCWKTWSESTGSLRYMPRIYTQKFRTLGGSGFTPCSLTCHVLHKVLFCSQASFWTTLEALCSLHCQPFLHAVVFSFSSFAVMIWLHSSPPLLFLQIDSKSHSYVLLQ